MAADFKDFTTEAGKCYVGQFKNNNSSWRSTFKATSRTLSRALDASGNTSEHVPSYPMDGTPCGYGKVAADGTSAAVAAGAVGLFTGVAALGYGAGKGLVGLFFGSGDSSKESELNARERDLARREEALAKREASAPGKQLKA